jgi:hypothetical protein
VAAVQYTDTHKQCRERHKANNKYNNTKIRKSAGQLTFDVERLILFFGSTF